MEKDATAEDVAMSENYVEGTLISVNSTAVKNPNPANLHNLLSSVYKKSPNSKTNVNNDSTSTKELAVSVFYYHSVHKYVSYHTHKANRTQNHSLLDRIVNVGVAGEDPRVRCNHPGHRIYIKGTDNHGINYIPIVIAGIFAKTTIGEVMIIMHQHSYRQHHSFL